VEAIVMKLLVVVMVLVVEATVLKPLAQTEFEQALSGIHHGVLPATYEEEIIETAQWCYMSYDNASKRKLLSHLGQHFMDYALTEFMRRAMIQRGKKHEDITLEVVSNGSYKYFYELRKKAWCDLHKSSFANVDSWVQGEEPIGYMFETTVAKCWIHRKKIAILSLVEDMVVILVAYTYSDGSYETACSRLTTVIEWTPEEVPDDIRECLDSVSKKEPHGKERISASFRGPSQSVSWPWANMSTTSDRWETGSASSAGTSNSVTVLENLIRQRLHGVTGSMMEVALETLSWEHQ
jgi:hypothetical protein